MDNKYECDGFKFVWGVKSKDDISDSEPCLYTMNDIEIDYDTDTGMYLLSIEMAYTFPSKDAERQYFRYCLDAFTDYVTSLHIVDKQVEAQKFIIEARSIAELYAGFKYFVEKGEEL